MAVSTNDLRNGMSLDLPEGLFSVVEFQHVKPGKGGAFVRTKLKNLRSGAVIERTYRADEKLEQAIIDKRDMQFLYRDGTDFVFMDTTTYEQMNAAPDTLGDAPSYLKEGDAANLQMYNGEIVGVDLPAAVELTVTETEPGMQGDRVSGARKAGHPADRACRPGAAVRQHGRRPQNRHPLRRIPDPGLAPGMTDDAPRHQQRERALSLLYEAELKGEDPAGRGRRPGRAARPLRAHACSSMPPPGGPRPTGASPPPRPTGRSSAWP